VGRKLGRAAAIAVLVLAGLMTPVFVAVAIDNDGDSDLIIGGIILAVLAVAVCIGAWFVQRALRPDRPGKAEPVSGIPGTAHLPASFTASASTGLPGLSEEADHTGRRLLFAAAGVVACLAAIVVLAT
jgi:hypothetical protein